MSDTATTQTPAAPRALAVIALEIMSDWKNVNYAAKPYLDAMAHLEGVADNFGHDDGNGIVRRFLLNAGAWRGETARRIKSELRQMAGMK